MKLNRISKQEIISYLNYSIDKPTVELLIKVLWIKRR